MKSFAISLLALLSHPFIVTSQSSVTCNPWYNLTNGQLPEGLYGAGFAQIDQNLYTAGGRGNIHPSGTNRVYVIDMPKQTVKSLQPLPTSLVFPQTVAFGADLFVLGGSTSFDVKGKRLSGVPNEDADSTQVKGGPLSNVVYQSTLGSTPWKVAGHLPIGVWGGCAVTFNDQIFYVGGSDNDPAYQALSSVYGYDINTGKTSKWANMNHPRFHPACVRFGRFIYVFGGGDPRVKANTIERFDPKTNTWTMMNGTLTNAVAGAAALVFENAVMLQGGWDSQTRPQATVDVYDPVTDSVFPAPPLFEPLSRLATGVLEEHLIYSGIGITSTGSSSSSRLFYRRFCSLA